MSLTVLLQTRLAERQRERERAREKERENGRGWSSESAERSERGTGGEQ